MAETETSLPKASESTLPKYVQILNENGSMNGNYLLNPEKYFILYYVEQSVRNRDYDF